MASNKAGKDPIRCAIVGYGGAFGMGKLHGGYINGTPGLQVVAACDVDAKRLPVAEADFPGIETYDDVGKLIRKCDFDLGIIITPHNTHAPLALKLSGAGKHVIVEKPMCLSIKEATSMIDAAKKSKKMLSVFHNRRWDSDFMTLKNIVDKGLLGEVFQVELAMVHYGAPRDWWRSNKKISGGAFYDWGAHLLDWLLNLVPYEMESVTGFFHKRVWRQATNEDHVEAMIRFKGGASANVQLSSIARAPKPRWRVCGTKGAAVDDSGKFRVYSEIEGLAAAFEVPYGGQQIEAWKNYYQNIADHLLKGQPLFVKPEEARRVITVLETAEKSSKSGKSEPVPFA